MSRKWTSYLAGGVASLVVVPVLMAQSPDPVQTPEGVVRVLYDLVSFDAGTQPDWDRVRATFLDEAVIVLRTGRSETSVFSVDGFVADWLRFIEQAGVDRTGFSERIIRLAATEFRDIAQVWVLYEATIPGSGRPPQQGVDSFSLVRRGDRWWIASVTNDLPTAEHPPPAVLRH